MLSETDVDEDSVLVDDAEAVSEIDTVIDGLPVSDMLNGLLCVGSLDCVMRTVSVIETSDDDDTESLLERVPVWLVEAL
jgi:hypothetical protein